MRLTTIRTMTGMSFRERIRRTNEVALIWLAHRLPRGLAYRSFIDTGVRLMDGNDQVTEVPYMTLLSRFER